MLGEHGWVGRGAPGTFKHAYFVPFLLRDPRGRRSGNYSYYYASTHDVAPTLLSLMGIDRPGPDGRRGPDRAARRRRPAEAPRLHVRVGDQDRGRRPALADDDGHGGRRAPAARLRQRRLRPRRRGHRERGAQAPAGRRGAGEGAARRGAGDLPVLRRRVGRAARRRRTTTPTTTASRTPTRPATRRPARRATPTATTSTSTRSARRTRTRPPSRTPTPPATRRPRPAASAAGAPCRPASALGLALLEPAQLGLGDLQLATRSSELERQRLAGRPHPREALDHRLHRRRRPLAGPQASRGPVSAVGSCEAS